MGQEADAVDPQVRRQEYGGDSERVYAAGDEAGQQAGRRPLVRTSLSWDRGELTGCHGAVVSGEPSGVVVTVPLVAARRSRSRPTARPIASSPEMLCMRSPR